MIGRFRFPIRLKILVTLLSVITVVVSLIIMTMAKLFNTDKTTYIRDLTSVIALHVAGETDSLLRSYHERLGAFSAPLHDAQLSTNRKTQMIETLFNNFQDFVALSVHEEGSEPIVIYDSNTLKGAALTVEDLSRVLSEPVLTVAQIQSVPIYAANATLTPKLPMLIVATTMTAPNGGKPVIITGLVRLDSLLRLATRPSAFQVFIVDAQGALLVDKDPGRIASRTVADWIPELGRLGNQQHLLGTTLEYEYEGKPTIGGFAPVKSSQLLVGVQIPKAAAYVTAQALLKNLVLLSLGLLVATALISIFLAHRLTRPLERLTEATRLVGKGNFNISVKNSSNDEIGMLSGSFNQMATELRERVDELRGAQAALMRSEKMSAFGQLSAGIAHEVKNPLAGILGHAQLCLRKLKKGDPLFDYVSIIESETKRCTDIISNLMQFASQEKTEHEPLDLNEVVRQAMAIVDHQLTINNVTIEFNLANKLPPIQGNANQLQQVLMNFAINAQQAFDDNPGVVRITTGRKNDGKVLLVFADNGPGIPENIRDKIFDPFFTTKAAGEGTGLGLSVTYGIIKDHHGEIKLESDLGVGTAFVMSFPAIVDEIVMQSEAT